MAHDQLPWILWIQLRNLAPILAIKPHFRDRTLLTPSPSCHQPPASSRLYWSELIIHAIKIIHTLWSKYSAICLSISLKSLCQTAINSSKIEWEYTITRPWFILFIYCFPPASLHPYPLFIKAIYYARKISSTMGLKRGFKVYIN